MTDNSTDSWSATRGIKELKCGQIMEVKAIWRQQSQRSTEMIQQWLVKAQIPSVHLSVELKWSPTTKWSVKAFQR